MNVFCKIISVLLLAGTLCSAADAQDFEVSPVGLMFNASPGTMQSREVVITNHSNNSAYFRLRVEDYDIDEEGSRHTRPRGTVRYSCSNWISVSPSTISVDPNSQGTAKVTMSVPADGLESRWAQIVVSEAHERTSFGADNGTSAGVVLSAEIVINVEQTPRDFADAKAQLSSFMEVEPDDAEPDTRLFSVIVENKGKTILNGMLYVVSANMDDLREFDVMKRQVRILSGATQKFRLQLKPGTLPAGTYDFTCLLDMGPSLPLKGIRLKNPVTITE